MSPARAHSIEVVAAMPPKAGESESNLCLTASTDVVERAPEEMETMEETKTPVKQHTEMGSREGSDEETTQKEPAAGPADPAALEEGYMAEGDQTLLLPGSMNEMDQMAASHALLSYTKPSGMNGIYNYGMSGRPGLPMLQNGLPQQPYPHPPASADCRISAYAKLEFEDGEFYMNTYQLIIGRDLAAARQAMRRYAEQEVQQTQEAIGADPKTPIRVKREESHYSKSIISESGGILREGEDSETGIRRRKSRKVSKKSKSSGSSSRHCSRRNSLVRTSTFTTYQPQAVAKYNPPDTMGAVPVDPATLRPSPHDCPVIGIHPPATTAASGYKAISRQHVKIAYNAKKYFFEAHIIGRNGAFVDDEFYYHNNTVSLKNGSSLQIGGVVVKFVLPDVAIGETGAEQKEDCEKTDYSQRYSEGGKEMSFDFEDAPRDGMHTDTTEELKDTRKSVELNNQFDDRDDEEEDEEINDNDDEEIIGEHLEEATSKPLQQPQKRRGPGRPPKNGIMSKREQRLLQKEAQQNDDIVSEKGATGGLLANGKSKVGRPRKHPLPPEEPPREKRKYTKRRPKEPKDSNNKGEGSGSDDKKDTKDKKRLKPPRSPTPTFDEKDLTPGQLAKPQANYVNLIYEALSNSDTGQMSLPQIYRAIQRKYPFFVLKCSTNGWQSSVRHNLSQNNAFRKVERDGKGWMWAIVEGVSIEKEKKRRATPPPQLAPGQLHHQAIYTGHATMMHDYPTGVMAPPPGYQYNMPLQPYPPGQFQPYIAPLQVNGLPALQAPMTGQLHSPCPPPLRPPVALLNAPAGLHGSGSTYSSPYAPTPATAVSPSLAQSQPTPPQSSSQPSSQPSVKPSAQATTPHAQALPIPTVSPPAPGERDLGTPVADSAPQAAASPILPSLSLEANGIKNAIESYKQRMVDMLRGAVSNSDIFVNSAINRYFGIPTPDVAVAHKQAEKAVIDGLKSVLSQMGVPTDPTSQVTPDQPKQHFQNPQNQAQSYQNCASNNSQQHINPPTSERPSPAILRPSMVSQNQNRPSATPGIPRPSLGPSNMRRSNSNGSMQIATSVSPAPTTPRVIAAISTKLPNCNGSGSRSGTPVNENPSDLAHTAGQKRQRAVEEQQDESSEDMHTFKRLSRHIGPVSLKT